MPKMKTKKSLLRRIKVTGTGKLMRMREGRRHLMSGKSGNRRRKLRKPAPVRCPASKTRRRRSPILAKAPRRPPRLARNLPLHQ